MNRRVLTIALGILSLGPAAASAGPELTLSAGLRSGDLVFATEAESPFIVCITTPCVVADVLTENDQLRWTLILDVPISRHWAVEALYSEQDGDHGFRSLVSPVLHERGSYEWTTAQVGMQRHWGEGRLRPFAAAALGATSFESTVPAYDVPFFPGITPTPVDDEVLSGSLAGGVKVDLGRHVALRLEGRGWWYDFPARLGSSLWQSEASVGLTYRW